MSGYIFINYQMVVVGALSCIQGLYLTSLKWLRPDIARPTDILFGLVTISYGLIFCYFNFPMNYWTQSAISLESIVVFWYIYQSISLRKKLLEQRNRDSVS